MFSWLGYNKYIWAIFPRVAYVLSSKTTLRNVGEKEITFASRVCSSQIHAGYYSSSRHPLVSYRLFISVFLCILNEIEIPGSSLARILTCLYFCSKNCATRSLGNPRIISFPTDRYKNLKFSQVFFDLLWFLS